MGATAMLVLLMVALLAGCGGDDSGGGPDAVVRGDTATVAEPPPTKAEFIQRWDAICAKSRRRADSLAVPGADASPAEQEKAVKKLAEIADDAATELERLERPSGDTTALDKYLDLERKQSRRVRRAAEAFGDGQPGRASALIRKARASGYRLRGLARGYGAKVCGSARS